MIFVTFWNATLKLLFTALFSNLSATDEDDKVVNVINYKAYYCQSSWNNFVTH